MKRKKDFLVVGLAAMIMMFSSSCLDTNSKKDDKDLFAPCVWIKGSNNKSESEMTNVRLLKMPRDVAHTDLLTELVEIYNTVQYVNAMQADLIANDRFYADDKHSPIAKELKRIKIKLNNSELHQIIEQWRNCLVSCMEKK